MLQKVLLWNQNLFFNVYCSKFEIILSSVRQSISLIEKVRNVIYLLDFTGDLSSATPLHLHPGLPHFLNPSSRYFTPLYLWSPYPMKKVYERQGDIIRQYYFPAVETFVSLWLTGRKVSRNLPVDKGLDLLSSTKGNKSGDCLLGLMVYFLVLRTEAFWF